MRKYLFLLLLLASTGFDITAQTISFPRKAATDSIVLADYMPVLARQVLSVYKDSPDEYNNNAFRYMLVAGDYAKAIATIDSIRAVYHTPDDPDGSSVIGFQFETYA